MLGALSLVLNGGGVAQLKTIASELNRALEGREDSAKSVFRQTRTLMRQLDDGKADIVTAIESLNRLSVSVNDQIGTIDSALKELPSALETLDQDIQYVDLRYANGFAVRVPPARTRGPERGRNRTTG